MEIDWVQFAPLAALTGGLLIGLATALLLFANGRIAGISGIVGGLLWRPARGDAAWRIAFVSGLLLAPVSWRLFAPLPPAEVSAGGAMLVAAGLLVGFGARLGSGCTSGHGVCGLSRRSPRSFVATATFMGLGFATVFAARHLFA